jgi:hypothetical protein
VHLNIYFIFLYKIIFYFNIKFFFAEYSEAFQTNVATLKLSEINVEDDIVIDNEEEQDIVVLLRLN